MLFLRLTFFLIVILGVLVYLISARLMAEFLSTGGGAQPLFRGHSEEYKAFRKNPPTPSIAKLFDLKKKLSIALLIAILSFLLAIFSVAL